VWQRKDDTIARFEAAKDVLVAVLGEATFDGARRHRGQTEALHVVAGVAVEGSLGLQPQLRCTHTRGDPAQVSLDQLAPLGASDAGTHTE
jgi:hypothetical protein